MSQTLTGLSSREADLLARLAASDKTVFRSSEVADLWPDPAAVRHVLSRLCKGGWIKRIERGLYILVPLSAGPERIWTEDALVIASRIVQPSAIAYWSALRFWNFTEQLPHTVFVQSPHRKFNPRLTLEGVRIQLVTISQYRFFGFAERSVSSHRIQVTDREKTIIDAADRPGLCGGVWQLANTLRVAWRELDWVKLDSYMDRFASGAVYKRLGYLVETLALPIPQREAWLATWNDRLTAGVADLDPSEAGSGSVVQRWRIRDNVSLMMKD